MPQVPRNVFTKHDDHLWSCALPNAVTRRTKVIVVAHKQDQWLIKGVHIGYFGATEVLLDDLPHSASDELIRKVLRQHARRIKEDYTRYGYWRRAERIVANAQRGLEEARRSRHRRRTPEEARQYHDLLSEQ